jgi:DNA-binding NarL/FixJ family response regulator
VAVCRHRHALLKDAGFAVVGQNGTADDLMLKVRSDKPDVAIIDIRMPTPREREVLALMPEGLSNLAIAERTVVTRVDAPCPLTEARVAKICA